METKVITQFAYRLLALVLAVLPKRLNVELNAAADDHAVLLSLNMARLGSGRSYPRAVLWSPALTAGITTAEYGRVSTLSAKKVECTPSQETRRIQYKRGRALAHTPLQPGKVHGPSLSIAHHAASTATGLVGHSRLSRYAPTHGKGISAKKS